MNACDDQSEPLGEAPELPKITATVQLAERQGHALMRIRSRVHEALKHPRSQAYFEAVLREVADLIGEAGA